MRDSTNLLDRTCVAGVALAAAFSLFPGPSVAATRAHPRQGRAISSPSRVKVKRLPSTPAEYRPTLRGTVFDPNGALILNAEVMLARNGEKGWCQKPTNDEGYFRFESLGPGSYTVVVKSPGFVTFRENSLEVKSNEDVSLEVTLEVGPPSEGPTVFSCGDAEVKTKAQ